MLTRRGNAVFPEGGMELPAMVKQDEGHLSKAADPLLSPILATIGSPVSAPLSQASSLYVKLTPPPRTCGDVGIKNPANTNF